MNITVRDEHPPRRCGLFDVAPGCGFRHEGSVYLRLDPASAGLEPFCGGCYAQELGKAEMVILDRFERVDLVDLEVIVR